MIACPRAWSFPEVRKPVEKPKYNDLPDKGEKAKGLILLTHGWNSSTKYWPDGQDGSGTDTAKGLKAKIIARLTAAKEIDNWDVVAYDWSDIKANAIQYGAATGTTVQPINDANARLQRNLKLADQARNNAMVIGGFLGAQIKDRGYEKVHFISHSAGAWLTDRAADKMKELKYTPEVQQTFLDTFMPLKDVNDDLGDSAKFAIQYVDTREYVKDKPFTNATLKHAYNLDITPVDPKQDKPFSSLSDEPDTAAHAWPHEWYRKTADDPTAGIAHTWGYNRSLENKNMPAFGDTIQGRKVEQGARHALPPPKEPKPAKQGDVAPKPPVDFRGGRSSLDGADIDPLTGTSFSLFGETGGSEPEALVQQLVQITDAVNLLHFDYAFEGSGQGFLSVYLDEELVFQADERYARYLPEGPDSEYILLGEPLALGTHYLSFRLDPFSDDPLYSPDTLLNVSNVWLGYAQVPEPASLVLLLMAAAGLLPRSRRRPSEHHLGCADSAAI